MNRRMLMGLLAGAIMTPEGLWMPDQKSIFLPARKEFMGHVRVVSSGIPESNVINLEIPDTAENRAFAAVDIIPADDPRGRHPYGYFLRSSEALYEIETINHAPHELLRTPEGFTFYMNSVEMREVRRGNLAILEYKDASFFMHSNGRMELSLGRMDAASHRRVYGTV
jgi:hypothetical protein